jgi:hypothetical protein
MDFNQNDALEMYRREVANVQPLTDEEQANLFQGASKPGEQRELAKRRLLEITLYLVLPIAERHVSSGLFDVGFDSRRQSWVDAWRRNHFAIGRPMSPNTTKPNRDDDAGKLRVNTHHAHRAGVSIGIMIFHGPIVPLIHTPKAANPC